MNSINSVIIEGVVSGAFWQTSIWVSFTVTAFRYEKMVGGSKRITTPVSVVAYGNVKDFAIQKVRDGQQVRVVGRLVAHPYNGSTSVYCEHLEIKPTVRIGKYTFTKD